MKAFASAVLLVALGAGTLTACSTSSSSSTSTTEQSASNAATDASAAPDQSPATSGTAAPASVPTYVNATETDKTSYGTPPPGGKAYVTNDDPVTVQKWYQAQVTGLSVVAPVTAKGGMLLAGDQQTGTMITLIGENGKTYILTSPMSAMK